MSEAADRYRTIAAGFTARLHGVPADRWEAATPCTDWNARDVATHVIDTHRRVLAQLDGSEPVGVGRDADLQSEWSEATGAVSAALADERATQELSGGPFGAQSFESLVGRLLCTDTLVHTWDLARGTGQEEGLDAAAVEAASAFLAPIDDTIRRPGGFAAKITPAEGADPQTRFLNFCGRPA